MISIITITLVNLEIKLKIRVEITRSLHVYLVEGTKFTQEPCTYNVARIIEI